MHDTSSSEHDLLLGYRDDPDSTVSTMAIDLPSHLHLSQVAEDIYLLVQEGDGSFLDLSSFSYASHCTQSPLSSEAVKPTLIGVKVQHSTYRMYDSLKSKDHIHSSALSSD